MNRFVSVGNESYRNLIRIITNMNVNMNRGKMTENQIDKYK